ncbi:hypothetical protein B0T18DRAFT_123558 [Schizothecium vesticola]|uniref:Uncharacterized protein n=1 Tax=Schizothecium vesticola TaxID=314040 RepID=A0AA40F2V2_9PEZI|nr:hypothetical protein B0T18DRAFT_123558 [Schizothecium vesticola]
MSAKPARLSLLASNASHCLEARECAPCATLSILPSRGSDSCGLRASSHVVLVRWGGTFDARRQCPWQVEWISTKAEAKRLIQHTTPGIRWSSPTQLLIWRLLACLWESGRDPEFSSTCGRMWEMERESVLKAWEWCQW